MTKLIPALLLCVACGSTGNDYNWKAPKHKHDASTPTPSPTITFPPPLPTLCARGDYLVRFSPTAQALALGTCDGYTTPASYGTTVGTTIHLLDCDALLTTGDTDSCTFTGSCAPSFENEMFDWTGEVVFSTSNSFHESIVDGHVVWTRYTGMVGSSLLTIGNCQMDVLYVEAD